MNEYYRDHNGNYVPITEETYDEIVNLVMHESLQTYQAPKKSSRHQNTPHRLFDLITRGEIKQSMKINSIIHTEICCVCCQTWDYCQKQRLTPPQPNQPQRGKYAMYKLSNCHTTLCWQCILKCFNDAGDLCPYCKTNCDELIGLYLDFDPRIESLKDKDQYLLNEKNFYYARSSKVVDNDNDDWDDWDDWDKSGDGDKGDDGGDGGGDANWEES